MSRLTPQDSRIAASPAARWVVSQAVEEGPGNSMWCRQQRTTSLLCGSVGVEEDPEASSELGLPYPDPEVGKR